MRDLNNDGRITLGNELFGSNTRLTDGQLAANGFIALAELDGNHDNKIDANDSAFNTLQIWQDTNGNAAVDSGELHSLLSLGIQSISTAYTSSTTVDANGNTHRQHGSYTRTDGSSAAADDVWYATDPTYILRGRG